jgi:hypothetical protein
MSAVAFIKAILRLSSPRMMLMVPSLITNLLAEQYIIGD